MKFSIHDFWTWDKPFGYKAPSKRKKWNLCYKHKRKSGLCCSFIIGTFLILALGLVWFHHENHASSSGPHALDIGKIYFRHSIALMLLPYFLSIPFYLLICVSFKWACSFWLPLFAILFASSLANLNMFPK